MEQYSNKSLFIDEMRYWTIVDIPIADILCCAALGIVISQFMTNSIKKRFYWALLPSSIALNVLIHHKAKKVDLLLRKNPFITLVLLFCVIKSLDVVTV